MSPPTTDSPITFSVHDVEQRTTPCPTVPMYENVKQVIGGQIESCSDYHTSVCSRMSYQPLLAAVYQSYSLHYPLVLSPDAVWLTISQGIAHHMAIYGEQLQDRFVAHQGQLELEFECESWVEGSPENPWDEAFEDWSEQIRAHIGAELHEVLLCNFSTTTIAERVASEIVMMDVFEKYFRYVLVAVCGIPEITLRGTQRDWERLAEKIDALEAFDVSWWLDHLKPLAAHFVRASKGDVDVAHWRNICKLEEAYGGHIINGWIAKLFPYIREFFNGPCSLRNPIFETGKGFQTLVAPSGLSQVPFLWRDLRKGTERPMEAIGGLVGVTQDQATLALEPVAGWAVRESSELEVALGKLKHEHAVIARPPKAVQVGNDDRRKIGRDFFPADLERFYFEFQEARVFDGERHRFVHICPRDEIESVNWGEQMDGMESRGPDGRTWYRFASLHDGQFLVVNLDANLHLIPEDSSNSELQRKGLLHPICVVREETCNKEGLNPVIALSFTEFITRLLSESSETKTYWQKTDFVPHGDAENFTRRVSFEELRMKKRKEKRKPN